jgi:hypothetical protein
VFLVCVVVGVFYVCLAFLVVFGVGFLVLFVVGVWRGCSCWSGFDGLFADMENRGFFCSNAREKLNPPYLNYK